MKNVFKVMALAAVASFGIAQAADLRICVEGAYPPFSQTNSDGSVTGFDIDITNALCDEMGKSCELVKTDWDGIIPALLAKKCDAIIASMSITPERQKQVDFSEKYYNTPNYFVARKGAGLTVSPEGLAGKVVGVQRGTIHDDYMSKKYPDVELRRYGTQEEANLDLTSGRLDAIIADSVALDEGFLQRSEGADYEFTGPEQYDAAIHGVGAGIAVRKNEEALRDGFSAAISAIRKNGVYKSINDKYFSYDLYGAEN